MEWNDLIYNNVKIKKENAAAGGYMTTVTKKKSSQCPQDVQFMLVRELYIESIDHDIQRDSRVICVLLIPDLTSPSRSEPSPDSSEKR